MTQQTPYTVVPIETIGLMQPPPEALKKMKRMQRRDAPLFAILIFGVLGLFVVGIIPPPLSFILLVPLAGLVGLATYVLYFDEVKIKGIRTGWVVRYDEMKEQSSTGEYGEPIYRDIPLLTVLLDGENNLAAAVPIRASYYMKNEELPDSRVVVAMILNNSFTVFPYSVMEHE